MERHNTRSNNNALAVAMVLEMALLRIRTIRRMFNVFKGVCFLVSIVLLNIMFSRNMVTVYRPPNYVYLL